MLRQSLPTCPFRGSSKILKHLFFILFAAGLCSAPARAGFAQDAPNDSGEPAQFDESAPKFIRGLDKGLVYGAAITGGVGLGLGILFTSLSFAAAGRASTISDEILASNSPGCVLRFRSPETGEFDTTPITEGECGRLQGELETRDAYRVGAVVGFVTASAALLAIGGYAIIARSEEKREALVLAPVFGPTMGGFALQGRF